MVRMALFTPARIGNLELQNRIVMSPVHNNYSSKDGFVTERMINYYHKRALTGLGLIIVEQTAVNKTSQLIVNTLGIWDDKFLEGLRELVKAIQVLGTKAAIQIADCIRVLGKKPIDLTLEDIRSRIRDFTEASKRAKEAGFDALEFHLAHSYTLADFLSPRANQRDDEYGGSMEGRFKIVKEIIEGARTILGKDYPFICRINGDDFLVGGITLKHSAWIAKKLADLGVDAIDVSAGSRLEDGGRGSYSDVRGKPTMDFPDGPHVYLAEEIKKVSKGTIIAVGKLGNPEVAERIVREGKADLIALGRPLIADGMWVQKVREGKWNEILHCHYCNRYLWERATADEPTYCRPSTAQGKWEV